MSNQQTVQIWASDESQFGLHTVHRQRIPARGIKLIGVHQHAFKNTWVFGVVEPISGASHVMEFPTLIAAMVQRFLDDFAGTYPDTLNLILYG